MIDIIQIITYYYDDLSWAQQSIAKVFLQNLSTLHQYTVSEVAELSSVSPAMIIKFCKKLGFEGYDELKYVAKYATANTSQIINPVINSILLTHDKNNNQYDEIAHRLKTAKRIFIFAKSNSANIAMDFYYKLQRVRDDVFFSRDSDEIKAKAQSAQKDDIVLFISNSGNARELVYAASLLNDAQFNQKNIILITNNMKAKLISKVGICLYGISFEQKNSKYAQYVPYAAKYSLMVILDGLFFAYFDANKKECEARIDV